MRGVYFAGNFLSGSTGVRGVSEDISEYFCEIGWVVFTASRHQNRLLRMADILWTAWHNRGVYQIAVVEVYSYLAFQWVLVLCQLLKTLKKPYILVLHGGRLPDFVQTNEKRFRDLLTSAKAVVTPSKYLQQAFIKIRNDIRYIPNGIDINRYPFILRERPEPRLSWLRAFHRIYNPKLAIEVLDKVTLIYPQAELLMIGPDKKDGSFDELIKTTSEFNLVDRVRFTGAVPKQEVGQYLSKSDIFLNTTKFESFGVSVLEAAACGLCIVTTNVGELPYLWVDGEDALIVPADNSEAMADAVMRILNETGLAETLSRNARVKAENYDWSVVLPQWESLLNKLIADG